MPRITNEPDAEVKRKGNTEYLKTNAAINGGWRAIRTCNATAGTWRLTALALLRRSGGLTRSSFENPDDV